MGVSQTFIINYPYSEQDTMGVSQTFIINYPHSGQ